jgi:hypothetical protein
MREDLGRLDLGYWEEVTRREEWNTHAQEVLIQRSLIYLRVCHSCGAGCATPVLVSVCLT